MNEPSCWKQGFETAQAAHKSFNNLGSGVRIYKCKACNQWHASNVKNDRFKNRRKR